MVFEQTAYARELDANKESPRSVFAEFASLAYGLPPGKIIRAAQVNELATPANEVATPRRVELNSEQVASLLKEISRLGSDPKAQVGQILSDKSVRAIALGVTHVDPPMTRFGVEIMPVLVESGITHLANAMPAETKEEIEHLDEHLRSGKRLSANANSICLSCRRRKMRDLK